MQIGAVVNVCLDTTQGFEEVVEEFFVPEQELSQVNCGALRIIKAIIILNKFSRASDEIVHKFPSLTDFPFSTEDLGTLSIVRYLSKKENPRLSNEMNQAIATEFDSYHGAQLKAIALESNLKSQGFSVDVSEITPALRSVGGKIFKLEPYD